MTAVDSPDDLATAVRLELEAHRRVSQDVQTRLQARFSIEACARNYHAIYRQVISERADRDLLRSVGISGES